MDLNFDLIAGDWRAALSHLHLQQILGLARQNRVLQALIDKLDAYDVAYQQQHDDYEEYSLQIEALIGADIDDEYGFIPPNEPIAAHRYDHIDAPEITGTFTALEAMDDEKKRKARVRDEHGRYVKTREDALDSMQRETLRNLVADKIRAYS